ncbi:MAG: nucleotidyl transferase AbiEii/AbiGii toxin family protein [Chloroflexi bacterium]|nr:nucleotidyl transferase AbiEii/AbiGii toxin family protein [Chloroflexota bacterium]
MKIDLLDRPRLEVLNKRGPKYNLQDAEKDYFLALVMQIISQSPLGDKLVFKGGTALHHCYLEQSRFSEDLDFSSNQVNLSLEEIRGMLTPVNFLAVKKDYQSEATIKIERLQYTGPLTLPNSLKVEIDRLQSVLLPPKLMKYNNIWGLDFKVSHHELRSPPRMKMCYNGQRPAGTQVVYSMVHRARKLVGLGYL